LAKTDNEKYVNRGRGLTVCRDPAWDADLRRANCHKNGAPFGADPVRLREIGIAHILDMTGGATTP